MRRMGKILLPAMLFIFLAAVFVVDTSRASGGEGREPFNAARAVESLETSEYLGALGIIPPNQEIEAIDFSVQSLGGQTERLSDHQGKVIFLNFWATWCGPCRAEVEEIDALHQSLKDEEFMIMALSIQEDKKKVSKFMQSNKVNFPVYLDSDGTVAAQYAVTGIPTTYIIDPDGKIVGRAIGPREWGSTESVELMRSLMN
jgi:thiol-disulfide isomerase/thioredoxin